MRKQSILLLIFLSVQVSAHMITEKFSYHYNKNDFAGKILPWNSNYLGNVYDHIFNIALKFWDTMRTDSNRLQISGFEKKDSNDPCGIGCALRMNQNFGEKVVIKF